MFLWSLDICMAGQQLNMGGTCEDCPKDYYQTMYMPRTVDNCTYCGASLATEQEGSNSSSQCKCELPVI